MKSLLTIFVSLIIITTGVAQTIRRVNNNPGISGVNVYSTAQAAHDAAVANDILIIEPSSASYGSLVLTKKLRIYGNGYFLTTNTEFKADPRISLLDGVEFNTGSGASELYGMTIGNSGNGTINIFGVSDLIISRNHVNLIGLNNRNKASTTNTNVANIIISKNYMGYITHAAATGFTISNVLVNNNIISYMTANSDPNIQNWVVRSNTFYSNSANLSLVNSVLENNFFAGGGTSPSFSNVTYSYNVSTGVSFSGGFLNVNSYDVVTDSELTGTGTGLSPDEAYIIKAGSDLKTLGNGGIEVGAFGGSTPYGISGIPAIPSIVNMTNSGTGDNSNPLKVNISVKSNN